MISQVLRVAVMQTRHRIVRSGRKPTWPIAPTVGRVAQVVCDLRVPGRIPALFREER